MEIQVQNKDGQEIQEKKQARMFSRIYKRDYKQRKKKKARIKIKRLNQN